MPARVRARLIRSAIGTIVLSLELRFDSDSHQAATLTFFCWVSLTTPRFSHSTRRKVQWRVAVLVRQTQWGNCRNLDKPLLNRANQRVPEFRIHAD
jgi:hypothetical protein